MNREPKQWQGTTDGTSWMHRSLIKVMRIIPLPVMYAGAALFVVPFYMLFGRKGYLAQFHFFRERFGMGRLRTFCKVYLNHCRFSQVVLDRFYMYAGGKFKFDIEHYDRYQTLAQGESGFIILSAHVGNYEVAGYSLVAKDKRFNALLFGYEAETVMKNRNRILSANNIRMIPIKDDMSHLYTINNALRDGETVSIPGDRVFGSPRTVECDFMGAKAQLPLGPFAIASQREVPVLTIHVMKDSVRRYRIFIEELHPEGTNIRERAKNLAQQYADKLEAVVRQYPTQWYNYYEFWQ